MPSRWLVIITVGWRFAWRCWCVRKLLEQTHDLLSVGLKENKNMSIVTIFSTFTRVPPQNSSENTLRAPPPETHTPLWSPFPWLGRIRVKDPIPGTYLNSSSRFTQMLFQPRFCLLKQQCTLSLSLFCLPLFSLNYLLVTASLSTLFASSICYSSSADYYI